MKRVVVIMVFYFVFRSLAAPLFAQEAAFRFMPASSAGSGGMHAAAEEGVYTLLGNPALLNTVVQAMYLSVSGGIGNVYQNGRIGTTVPPAYYTVTGPLAFGVVSKGVGFGLFNRLQFHENGLDAHFVGSIGIDWILINTPGVKLDFGLSPRFLLSYMQEQPVLLSAASITPGILCALGKRFSLGINYNDAASVAHYMEKSDSKVTWLSSSLNAGIALNIVSSAALGLTLYADYHDILAYWEDAAGDSLRQLSGGARIDFRNSFHISLGMFERAPTAGAGFNLGAVKVEVAFYANSIEAGIKIVRE
jgi:hypothetical protein